MFCSYKAWYVNEMKIDLRKIFNSDSINDSLIEINKKYAKSITTYDFSTLYTKLPHDKLVDEISPIIDFAFKGRNRSYVQVSRNEKAIWRKKSKGGFGFSKAALKTAVTFLK